MTEQSARDKIRAATVGSSDIVRSKIVKIKDVEIEVHQPTIEQSQIIEQKVSAVDGHTDVTKRILWTVIFLSYQPGTKTKVFEPTDFDTLLKKPTGGFVETLFLEICALSNTDVDVEKKS